jgi:peptidyl-prolyl cis-trans isomerase B (cyclophilin B)
MKKVISVCAALSLVLAGVVTAAPASAAVTCKKVDGKLPVMKVVKQPTKKLKTMPKTATFYTNCGEIRVALLGDKAPETITAFAALVKGGYYDKTYCHRMTTNDYGFSILQCGDPKANGTGNPEGWNGIYEENLPKLGTNNYPAGTLAMAKQTAPKTTKAQFFFVYEDSTFAQPVYTVWAKVTKGLDILKFIGSKKAFERRSDGKDYYVVNGAPVQAVKIEKIVIK